MIGDFNIHVDIESNSLSAQFKLILDYEFLQFLNVPTHNHKHTEIVLSFGFIIYQVTIYPQMTFYPITWRTFSSILADYIPTVKYITNRNQTLL